MYQSEYLKKTAIIIPAFNEKVVIGRVVEELLSLGCSIIVVDDGSTENLRIRVTKYREIIYIRHKVNLGQGAALQTGIDFALKQGALWFVTFDGDGQHSAGDIPAMLTPLFAGQADIVLASRFLTKGSHNASVIKQMILKTGRWINYLFTGLYLSDAHNGLRAMNRIAANSIRITENRMAHATEIVAQIKKHKLRYREVGAKVIYTAYSSNKGQSSLNSLKIFFDLVLQTVRMNGIQIVLITAVVLVAIYFFVRLHNSILDFLLLLSMVTAALVFIFLPDITNTIAHKLGVGRGADLVFYLSIVIFWFVIIKLYIRIRKLEKIITDVVRKDALNEAAQKNAR